MDPVRRYGDALVLVTVTRTAVPPALPPAPRVLHVALAGAPAVEGTELLRLPEDVGRPAAVNRAVAGLGPDVGWVAVADPGVEWAPGTLERLLAAARRRPRAGILGPRLLGASGAVLPSAGAAPSFADAVRGRTPASPVPDGPTGWLAGTCLLLRRAAWDSVGGYDPRYVGGDAPDPADLDLGDRLRRAGWLVVGVPSVDVTVRTPCDDAARPGILESRARGLRRYGDDRHRAPARALLALTRRDRSHAR